MNRRRRWLAAAALLLAGCTTVTVEPPTPGPTRTPIRLGPTSVPTPTVPASTPPAAAPTPLPLPDVSASDWSLGPVDAPATLLIYADFQSPGSANVLRAAFFVADQHPDEFRWVFRHLPLVPSFDKDSLAGQAVEAAGAQGRFWEAARALVDNYEEWSPLAPADFRVWLEEMAGEIDLDVAQFNNDIENGRYAAFMMASYQDALASGLPGPPILFLNGNLFRVPPTLENLEASIRLEVLAARAFDGPPPMTLRAGSDYFATLVLDEGEVVIELLPQSAPEAVNSFVFLARQDWFDGTSVYRVVPGGWVEAGDPSGTGLGEAGYHLPDEIDPAWTFDEAGIVALASVAPGTGGSRFMISLGPLPTLDGSRTIFGRVLRGLDLLQELPGRDPTTDLLIPGAAIVRDVVIEVDS